MKAEEGRKAKGCKDACESAGLMVASMAKFSYMRGGSSREWGVLRSEPEQQSFIYKTGYPPHLNHSVISVKRVIPACITVKELYSIFYSVLYSRCPCDCTFHCIEK
jgi:hypothetical protein